MKNLDEQHLKIIGKTVNVDFGLICTQLISIEARLQALTEFVIKKATKEEKIRFNESINNHRKELEIMVYNLYQERNKSDHK